MNSFSRLVGLMFVMFLVFRFVPAAHATPDTAIPLTEKGKSASGIVLESGHKPRASAFAARELAFWLKKISGAEIPVRSAPDSGWRTRIFIGTPDTSPAVAALSARFPDDLRRLRGNDGFLIHAENHDIFLLGTTPKGVLNAVYAFLERTSDIIFVRPSRAEDGSGTVFGFQPSLNCPGGLHVLSIPALTDHRYFTCDIPSALWQTRNRNLVPMDFIQNKDNYEVCADMGVPWVRFISLCNLIPKEKYLNSHPEFFPLIRGKRQANSDYNLCFMNPLLPDFAVREVERIADNLPKKVMVSGFGHGDHGIVCSCPLCTVPVTAPDGTVIAPSAPNFRSAQYAVFVGRMAERLKKTHPEITVSAGGYLFTAEPPGWRPGGNTAVCLCPYPDRNMKFSLGDERNARWRNRAEGFFRTGGVAHLYEYYLCDATPQFYHPVSDVVQKDLQYFRAHGLKGMYLDTVRHDDRRDATEYAHDMSAMEFYTISRLMWDPDQSVDALRREFCRRAYREAADPMRRFYELIRESYYASATPGSWRDHPGACLRGYVVKPGRLSDASALLDQAELAARHRASRELVTRLRNRFFDLMPAPEFRKCGFTLPVPKVERPPAGLPVRGPDWTGAALIDLNRFIGSRPPRNQEEESPEYLRDEIRLLHDGKNLYVGWIFGNPPTEHSRLGRDTFPRGSSGEMCFVSARRPGTPVRSFLFDNMANQYDALGDDVSWISAWTVKTDVRSEGLSPRWSAFAVIPLKDLEFAPDGSVRAMFVNPVSCRTWFGGDGQKLETFHRLIFQQEVLQPFPGEQHP